MFSKINFLHMLHKGWMKNGSSFAPKWMKIAAPLLVVFLHNHFVRKTPRVLFRPQVHCVLGNFLLKLLVEAYDNKVQQVYHVVVGLRSSLESLLWCMIGH